mgnify:CR=1 FL=1
MFFSKLFELARLLQYRVHIAIYELLEEIMPALNKMSRTDVSAIISVLLFSVTILISAVGPAQAEGTIDHSQNNSPPVIFVNPGYPA